MRMGRLIAVGLAAVAVGFVLWLVGMAAPFAIAAGLLVIAVALLWECRTGVEPGPRDPAQATSATGARQDVTRLAWSLRATHGRVGDSAQKRVRAVAERRLNRRGLSLENPEDDEAIIALIGARGHAITSPRSLLRAERSDIDDILNRLSVPPRKENS